MTPTFQDTERGITLYCGDCLEILPQLEGVDAVITDPPYGIGYSHGGNSGVLARTTKFVGAKVIGDDCPFNPNPFLSYPVVVLWGGNHYASRLPDSSAWLVWDKRDGLNGNDLADCELAWTSLDRVARLKSLRWMGMIKDTERGEERLHSTQKPIALMEWCMDQVGVEPAQCVLDPYMGSGTTGIACLRTGRRFIGIEKDPKHFQTALDRIKRELAQGVLQLA